MTMHRRRERRHGACSGVEEEKMDWLALLEETWSRSVQEGEKDVAKRMGKMRQRAVAGICTFQLWENEWFRILKQLIPELGNTGH